MTATVASDYFARSVRERLFAPRPADLRRVGAEIEMLPLLDDSGLPCPVEAIDPAERSTLAFLRPYGDAHGWAERRSSKGAPYFALPNGSTLTFEPGGQLELCTPASDAISAMLTEARLILTDLRCAADAAGITLASVGIDPMNDVDQATLQLPSKRYVEMTRYFERIGPYGVRMMRQTAATQVSVDPGPDPAARWRLLADLTPYLTAIFANSSRYAGCETEYESFRARCWRLLDPSRTGVPHPELPAEEAYTRFALDAVDMTRTDSQGTYRSFGDWLAENKATAEQWENHLTTLFPEVRPRGHLEVRSIDALEPRIAGAAVLLIAGIVYDDASAAEARAIVSAADEEILNQAARCGVHDAAIARTAVALTEIGMRGARGLGERVITGADLEAAADFFARWTHCQRAPADAR